MPGFATRIYIHDVFGLRIPDRRAHDAKSNSSSGGARLPGVLWPAERMRLAQFSAKALHRNAVSPKLDSETDRCADEAGIVNGSPAASVHTQTVARYTELKAIYAALLEDHDSATLQ